jgi:PAS domain-containing protein
LGDDPGVDGRHQATAFAALAVLVDISDKARQAEELVAARDRLAAITSSIGEGLLVLNPSGVVCDANDAAGSLLAMAPTDAVGHDADALLYGSGDHPGVTPGTDSDAVVRIDDDVFVRGDATTLQVRAIDFDAPHNRFEVFKVLNYASR